MSRPLEHPSQAVLASKSSAMILPVTAAPSVAAAGFFQIVLSFTRPVQLLQFRDKGINAQVPRPRP
jgi:hypothetical protein